MSDVIWPEDGWHLKIRISNCIAPSHREIRCFIDKYIQVEMAEKLHLFFFFFFETSYGSSLECWMTTGGTNVMLTCLIHFAKGNVCIEMNYF